MDDEESIRRRRSRRPVGRNTLDSMPMPRYNRAMNNIYLSSNSADEWARFLAEPE
jgi:hypothetical protein